MKFYIGKYNKMQYFIKHYARYEAGFFFFLGGPGPQQKFAHFTPVTSFWPEPVTPNWVLSLKISNILPHFTLKFDYFLVQNCIQKALFYA